MTLDLDELERKAKAALTADDAQPKDMDAVSEKEHAISMMHEALPPSVVLALTERVREAIATANARWGAMKDAEDREKDQRNRAEAAERRVAELEQRQVRGPVTVGMHTPTGFEPYPGHTACGMDFDTWADVTRKRIAANA